MTAASFLESALSPADIVRKRLLHALGPMAGRLAADRELRVAWMGGVLMVTSLLATLIIPLWMLALGPIVLGVPHLLADIRYLWVRPGLHRRLVAWLAIGGPLLIGIATGRLVAGLLAAAGALLIARTTMTKRLVGLGVVSLLIAGAVALGHMADLIFAHLHNVIAVAMWWAWRPRTRRLHWIPLVAFAMASVALLWGLGDGWAAWHIPNMGPSIRYHSASLAPGLDATVASRLVLLFCFAQSVHYGVWLRLVPEEDRPRATPRTFAASGRQLLVELGLAPILLCLALCVGLACWALLDLAAARTGYLRFATFHGQLELAAVALMLAQRGLIGPGAPISHATTMTRWLAAFLFTQLVEVPIYTKVLAGADKQSLAIRLLLAFGASALTHPIVWFVFPRIVSPYWTMVLCAEAFAIIAEAAYFAVVSTMNRPLLWAFVANAASVCLGFTCRALFGLP